MPTGYTAGVADGEVTEFADFARLCARAMGATIMQRDDSLDAPLRLPEASTFYRDHIAKDEARLAEVKAWSVEDAERDLADTTAKAQEAREGFRRDAEAKEARYRAMLAKVEAWTPPTSEHDGLKRFMAEQLAESIKFDCGRFDYPLDPPARTGLAWKSACIATAEADLARDRQEWVAEQERTEARRRWITDLLASLDNSAEAVSS